MINPSFGSYYKGTLPSSGGNPYGQLFTSLVGMGYDAYQQNQQRKANIKSENKARAYNLEQWHRQNRYNHPIQQMARLKDAGLNPNLIYGSSPGSAVGNAGSVSPGQAPAQPYGNFVSPAIEQFQNLRLNQAQTNNLTADAMLKGTQSMKTAVESGMKGRELDLLNAKFDDLVGLTKSELALKNIDYKLKEGVIESKISSAMSQAEKDSLAVKLLQKDLELAQQGYVKGNYIGTILGNAFGVDLNTKEGKTKAQIIVGAILGSSIYKNLSQGLQTMIKNYKR